MRAVRRSEWSRSGELETRANVPETFHVCGRRLSIFVGHTAWTHETEPPVNIKVQTGVEFFFFPFPPRVETMGQDYCGLAGSQASRFALQSQTISSFRLFESAFPFNESLSYKWRMNRRRGCCPIYVTRCLVNKVTRTPSIFPPWRCSPRHTVANVINKRSGKYKYSRYANRLPFERVNNVEEKKEAGTKWFLIAC